MPDYIGNLCGILSSFCFIICLLPQVYLCYKNGNGKGLNTVYLFICLLGELFLTIYAVYLNWNFILLLNGLGNIIFIIIILKYIYFPRK